ncbi:MAG: DUF427 domain-containing protein [Bacteroidetes bacterium]|nr:MAG: DUF427 domain-containing protein [Bacteroidota bacterium]
MKQAIWNGQVIAESDQTLVLEGNDYFPADSIRKEYFKASDHHTLCPWKGIASYYHIQVAGKTNENAAWYYPDPKPAAAKIKDRIAFWRGVEVKAL